MSKLEPKSAGFLPGNSATARSIGYEEEKSPTLKGSCDVGVLVLNDQGGGVMNVDTEKTATLRAESHGHEPIVFEPGIASRDGGHIYTDGKAPTLRASPGDNHPTVVYSFDSLNSNSMKSPNPNSGCRMVETAKTLDTSTQDPSKNQGGIAIIQEPQQPIAEQKIVVYDVPNAVTVRKHKVDVDGLRELLRCAVKNIGLSRKQIAEQLAVPQTMVDHWFRTDNCFAVPDKEIWLKLKELLKIESDEYDSQIMEFEEKTCNYDMSNRIYDAQGIAPTITSTSADKTILTSYCIAGNTIDRQIQNGGNGKGTQEELSYTLNTIDRHAVAICSTTGSFMQTEIEKSPPLTARDYKDPNIVTVSYQDTVGALCASDCKGKNGQDVSADKLIIQNDVAVYSSSKASFHTQFTKNIAGTLVASDWKDPPTAVYGIGRDAYNMGKNAKFGMSIEEDVQPTLTARGPGAVAYSSSRAGYWCDFQKEKSGSLIAGGYKGQNTVALLENGKAVDVRNSKEGDVNGALQSRASNNLQSNNVVRQECTVRRLTPIECERLMGLPDNYTNVESKYCSDSARYKALGNGMAQPCADFIIQGIVDFVESEENNV